MIVADGMTTASPRPSQQAFVAQQNRIRGAIALAKSKRFGAKRRSPFRSFRQQLTLANFAARAQLHERQFDEFFAWMNATVKATLPELEKAPVEFDYLGGFAWRTPIVRLEKELLWIAKSLKHHSVEVNHHRRRADKVTVSFLSGDYDSAISELDEAAGEHGQSFWLIQLRIAIEQRRSGLEKQKDYVKQLRSKFNRGVLSFVAYFTGVRVEDKTSWPRFVEMIEEQLSGTHYKEPLKNYFRFRLTNSWPTGSSGICDVLRIEQNHSVIDQYETLVSFFQVACESSDGSLSPRLVLPALRELADVNDFRLDKVSMMVGGDRSIGSLPIRDTLLSDALFEGDLVNAARTLRCVVPTDLADPWHLLYAGVFAAHLRWPLASGASAQKLERSLGSILARDIECQSSIAQVDKLSNTLDGLPPVRALRFLARSFLAAPNSDLLSFDRFTLNSPTLGSEDAWASNPEGRTEVAELLSERPSMTRLAWGVGSSSEDKPWTVDAVRKLVAARDFIHRGDASSALPLIRQLPDELNSEPLRNLAVAELLACHQLDGDRLSTISAIADEAARNESSIALLPVQIALKGLAWPDYKPLADELRAGIALDALMRATDSDTAATLLRFSFSYQLKRSGLSRPSMFADQVDRFSLPHLVYYLRYICVPSIMDMSRAFRSSREVLEERKSVCAALKLVDPDRVDDYDAQIFSITNLLVVEEGLKLVDRSRLHVDASAFARWAKRALTEDFERYTDLVSVGIGAQDEDGDAIREIFKSLGTRQIYHTPDDQSDAILVDMLGRLRDVFLSNSDYGLDYFLSKRVRHQSFVGLIRGPLEFSGLITTRRSEFGPYRENEHWISLFEDLGQDQRSRLSSSFSGFSEDFDRALAEVRDRYFQIKNADHPDGLFDITLTTQMIYAIRIIMQSRLSFDDFLQLVSTLFWGALERSLSAARELIADRLKSQLTEYLVRLREEIRAICAADPHFMELSVTVNEVSAEVQRNLDQAASWFAKPEGQQGVREFTLDQSIEIAVSSAMASHRASEIDLSSEIVGAAKLDGPDLLLVVDATFIALDNVKRHGGLKQQKVSVVCDAGRGDDVVYLDVVSGVAKSRVADIDKKLVGIRAQIAAGGGAQVRREGGTGFLKLAAAVRQAADGRLDFGVTEEGEFRLSICFKPTRFMMPVIVPE